VGLARALLAPASLWLIDEPLSALDPMRARMAMTALVGLAAERQVTLVATLHQVDTALAHFPRVLALRDGAVAFDLPSSQVTREHLERLYAQHEHELRGEVAAAPDGSGASDEPVPPKPAVMHCR
jgi:phosphonate transport system ATP-binding protein